MTSPIKYQNVLGVLTADEVAFSGAAAIYSDSSEQYTSYMKHNAIGDWWTMTPAQIFTSWGSGAMVYYVEGSLSGTLLNDEVDINYEHANVYLRPSIVISATAPLKTGLTYTPDGTIDKPYVIG